MVVATKSASASKAPRAQAVTPGLLAPDGAVPWLMVRGAAQNNLNAIDAAFPLGRFTCVTGVSGSGKSSLVNDILYAALARHLNRAQLTPGRFNRIEIADGRESDASERKRSRADSSSTSGRIAASVMRHLDKVIAIDQSPIGRTPRSNPATYIKLFDEIRDLYTRLPDAKLRGYKPGRFSFNVASGRKGGGRCEACEGNGANRIEMDFLADVWVTCSVCEGQRFTHETLQIQFKNKSISDVLDMDVQQALDHFDNQPRIRRMLQTLHDVGLDYIKLGQPSPTLSGGEAQRIKLARELVKRPTGRTLYVLDEPTTGLHFDDIRKLLAVLHGFVDAGNTVVVIEHNLDVIKTADWIIDLGPEGGHAGGRIVAEGTPEEVAGDAASHTGRVLAGELGSRSEKQRANSEKREARSERRQGGALSDFASRSSILDSPSNLASDSIVVRGAAQHNLKHVDIAFPRDRMTVCTGVSGSGKTSFAIDTIYTEGHRRYVESLSAYARQFLGQMQKPKVEHIEGLSPAICIEQKAASKSPRSTVGTITEIYDYLRVLWARVGTRYCPRCEVPIGSQTVDEIVNRIMALPAGAPIILLAPVALGEAEGWASVFTRLKSSGYTRVRIDGTVLETAHATTIDARRKHRVEVVVDRTVVRPKSRSRITEAVEHALMLGNGLMTLVIEESHTVDDEGAPTGDAETKQPAESPSGDVDLAGRDILFSQRLACTKCGTSFEELSPHNYSFNSQMGWCETCEGLGVQRGAPAASIIRHPTRGLLDGAIAGWGRIDPVTPFGRVLVALCRQLGVAAKTPLEDWTAEQRQMLLYGTTGDWIAVPPDAPGRTRRAAGDSKGNAGASAFDGPYRFHWRGFFPAIDNATRNSWSLRHRLHNVVTDIPCITCRGGRLRADAAATRLLRNEKREARSERRPEDTRSDLASRFSLLDSAPTLVGLCQRPLHEVAEYFRTLKLSAHQREIAGELVYEIRNRLQFLLDVGLEYLTLHRAAPTLSGGEAQRIRLASQIGSGLSGVLYVLDEPTIGLHPRDTKRLVAALSKLRSLGNTLLLVEHDREVIAAADRILDFGPRAGRFGGEVVAQGTPANLRMQSPSAVAEGDAAGEFQPRSLTRGYLGSELAIAVPSNRRPVDAELGEAFRNRGGPASGAPMPRPRELTDGTEESSAERDQAAPCGWLVIRGARQNNLKNINVPFPLGRFVCVTGVSGSGKSSLINDILWPALANKLMMANLTPGEHDGIDLAGPSAGKEPRRPSAQHVNARLNQARGAWRGRGARLPLDKVINVDQSPLGATPSSNPATYTGVFDLIRELFARLPDSKLRGYNANRFSFNRPGGRCEACEGYGQKCIEMHFMPDVWVECEVCQGRRYEPETLQVRFKEKNISDVLDLPVPEALALFESVPKVRRLLQMLVDVGLGYVQLGQPAPTLSGGEAQRVKLASELGKPGTGRTLYILDEPTTGLHFDDVRKLLDVLHRLADLGNTIVCVEHNLDVLKSADWIIDLGPEAGDAGGQIVAMGTPEDLVRTASEQAAVSHTTAALAPVLAAGPVAERQVFNIAEHLEREAAIERAGLGKIGREVKQPWQIDGRKWHLSQRTSRDGKAARWKSEALEFVIELVHAQGGFGPTNWNDRASVEITAAGAEKWFLHALTGGEWLLELYFVVPAGAFNGATLDRKLGLRTLDQREDIQAYGSWPRVDVRPRIGGVDAIAIYVHDRDEIDTPAFRDFIRQAVRSHRSLLA